MGKSTISMAIFNSYVKLPEGTFLSIPLQTWIFSWVLKGDADLDGVKSLEGKLHMALSEHGVLVQFLWFLSFSSFSE
jgi:hypothetical protein